MADFLKRVNLLKLFRIITVILLIFLMAFIFNMSAQTAEESSSTSGSVISLFTELLIKDFDSFSPEKQTEIIASYQFIARKTAHFTAYAAMGVLAFLSIVTYKNLSLKIRTALSAIICLLYSISDEIHQSFIPGRSCELRDICIDMSGSLLTIILLFVIIRFSKSRFLKKLR